MGLSRKQRAFVESYLSCWNATEAARAAGYSVRSARSQGCRLLQLPEVAAAIRERLEELTMSADEVLVRLAEQARAEYAAYLLPDGTVDLAGLLTAGKGHLVKGLKWQRGELVVEFHDAQAALLAIGKHHRLFADEARHLNVDLASLSDAQLERLAAGEDVLVVLGTSGAGGAGEAGAAGQDAAAVDAAAGPAE